MHVILLLMLIYIKILVVYIQILFMKCKTYCRFLEKNKTNR